MEGRPTPVHSCYTVVNRPLMTSSDMEVSPSPELTTVPKNITDKLLHCSDSSTLNDALEALIELSRTVQGRSDLASKNMVPVVLDLVKSLSNTSNLAILSSSLKLLRNLCAGEISNQNSFIEANGVEVVSIVLSSLGFVGSNSSDHYVVVRMGLQGLGNVCLAGEEHRMSIWDRFFPGGFAEIARIRRSEIVDPLCMVLRNCCNGRDERVLEICGSRGLSIVAEIVRTASEVGFEENWLNLLLSEICFEGSHFSSLFSELSSAVEASDDFKCQDVVFTVEQSFLLSILSEKLNQKIDELTVSIDFALYIYAILKRALGAVDFSLRGRSGLPTGSPSIDVLGYSVTILRDICAKEGPGSSKIEGSIDVVDSLLSLGFLDLLLDILRSLEPPEIIRKSISRGGNQVENSHSDSLKVCPYKGFRRDIVAVVGNCLYRRKHVQDKIRQKNGILLMMQQCVTDECNPFMREWGIWSVRNLLEGNEENQREVAEMELQGSVDVPEISGLGLRVEVDEKNHRAKLVNIS